MPLGERGIDNKGESRYSGVETEFSDDVPQLLSFNLSHGCFDFVVAPLMNPTSRPNLLEQCSNKPCVPPFAGSDLVVNPSRWSSHVVGNISSWIDLDSDDLDVGMDSETTLKQEIAWASHLSLQAELAWANEEWGSYWEWDSKGHWSFIASTLFAIACLLPTPKRASCENYARCVNQILQDLNNMQLWLRVPLVRADNESIDETFGIFTDYWEMGNIFRQLCEHDRKLSVALDVLYTVSSNQSLLQSFYNDVKLHKDVVHFETAYVVKMHSVARLAPTQPVFTFIHPNCLTKRSNQRFKRLQFQLPTGMGSALVHGTQCPNL